MRDIGEKFGVGESAVSQGSRRMQVKLAEDDALRGEIDLICRILGVVNV
ncbi:hypothetical protein [Desulfuromusa kysingii]|nr:hypothetical protein [Desulfuromusa kysingii]